MSLCRALAQSGIDRDEVNYVNAHATSTKAGDMAEYRAIREILPGNHLRMNATKSMLGHLLGAAGAVEAIAAIEAIRTGTETKACLVLPYSSSCRTIAAIKAIRTGMETKACLVLPYIPLHVGPSQPSKPSEQVLKPRPVSFCRIFLFMSDHRSHRSHPNRY